MNYLSKPSAAFADLLRINAGTKVCAVIGDPVAHSLSPSIHNAAFRSLGMDLVYIAFRVRKGELTAAMEGMRALGIAGMNVTIPHKTGVVRFLDSVERTAREIGAANTVVRTGSGLRGYNTDGPAALEVLRKLGGPLSDRKAVILGAGGAARAISYYLSDEIEEMSILNRTRSKASSLATAIMRRGRIKCESQALDKVHLLRQAGQADLLINTLPVDAFPRYGKMLIQEGPVRSGMMIFDANYIHKSDFLAEATRRGAKVADGLEMLVGQAGLSFKLWTGRDAPIQVMSEAAIKAREARGR